MNTQIIFLTLIALFSFSALSLRTTTAIDMWGPVGPPLILSLEAGAPPTKTAFESTSFNTIIGGERDILITAEEGAQSVVSFAQVNDERLSFAAPSQMVGSFLIQWDGMDNSPDRNNGLGGINLAADGGDRFHFVIETDVEAEFLFSVYSGDRVSTFTLNVDRELGPITYTPRFSQFTGNADFTSVDTIELFTEFDGDLDFSIFKIEIVSDEETPSPVSFSPVSPISISPVSVSPVSVSPISFSPESTSPESVSPISFSPESTSTESSSPSTEREIERIEFVRPIIHHFIDYNHQCERVVIPGDDDDNSSSSLLLPSGIILVLLVVLF